MGSESIDLSGNGDFYGAVYAPDAAVTLSGNGDFYGAIACRSLTINGNGGLHYDQALLEQTVPGPFRVTAWWRGN